MTELGEVISTTPYVRECVRTTIGLGCLEPTYPCLCGKVSDYELEIVRNNHGEAAVVQLRLSITTDPKSVMDDLNFTAYRADYLASKGSVTATWNLRRPENLGLKEHIRKQEESP